MELHDQAAAAVIVALIARSLLRAFLPSISLVQPLTLSPSVLFSVGRLHAFFSPTSAASFPVRAFRVSTSLSGTFPMAISTIIFDGWVGARGRLPRLTAGLRYRMCAVVRP